MHTVPGVNAAQKVCVCVMAARAVSTGRAMGSLEEATIRQVSRRKQRMLSYSPQQEELTLLKVRSPTVALTARR